MADVRLPDGTNVARTLAKEEAGAGEKPLPLTLLPSKTHPVDNSLSHECNDPVSTSHVRE